MSLTVPTSFQQPSPEIDTTGLLRAAQAKAMAESGHFVRSRLRPFLSFGGEALTETSTSYVDVIEELAIEASANNSDSVTATVYGSNTTVLVSITDASATTVTVAISTGAGPATASGTINTSTLTGTSWRMKVQQKVPATGTATLIAAHIRETRHTSGTIA